MSIVSVALILAALALQPVSQVAASATDGTIDSTNRYAWSENAGWIDFGSTLGDVRITDSALSGYAWGETIGWISLNCSNTNSCATVDYKVTNNGEGTLGGYAWSENVGWIDFDPTNGGVTISSAGVFSGYAWGELVGWIVFNCSNESSCATVDYKVLTDWRPQSSSERASGHGGGSNRVRLNRLRSGGGGGPVAATEPATQTVFVPDYTGLITGHIRSEEDYGERPPPDSRRIAQVRQAIVEHFAQQLAQAEELEQVSEVVRDAWEASDEHPPSDAVRHLARAERKVAERKSDRMTSTTKIAERRGLLVSLVDNTPILYTDVPTDSWYAPYIAFVVEERIAQGYENPRDTQTREFGVGDPITHAEIIKMAFEAAGTDTSGVPPPRNVSAQGTWAAPYIAGAEARGMAMITPDLDVHSPATRGEVIWTILEVMGIPVRRSGANNGSSFFTDLPDSHPHADAINIASTYGFISGDTDAAGNALGTVRPDDQINRAEASKIIALVKEVLR